MRRSLPPVAEPAPAFQPAARRAPGPDRRRRGFTLVEAMIASGVFIMVTLGVYAMLIKSYQLAALSRTRDEARAVLRTFGDQFERLQTTDVDSSGSTYTRWLFYPEGVTGRGLSWGSLSTTDVHTELPAVSSLAVTLGQAGHTVAATVTRDVSYIDDASGATTSSAQIKAAGYMMKGTFAITFSMNAKSYTETLTVVRAVP